MLVLSRKANEAVVINQNIRIQVISIRGDRVRLGIDAPPDVLVDRAEVHERRMQFVEVVLPGGICEETIDLGGALFAYKQHASQ